MNSRKRSAFFCRFHRKHNRFRYVVSIITIYSFMFFNVASAQQIVVDGQTKTRLTVNQNVTDVTTSTIYGQNAFNSFSEFNVYQGNVVNLHVPDSAGNLLNMVYDSQTNIDGILNSYHNGRIGGNVYFANPHGFVVGSGGVVNVGSLTAIAPTRSFMDSFFDASGNPNLSATSQLLSGSAPINSDALISIQGQVNALTDINLAAGSIENLGLLASGASFDWNQVDLSDVVNLNDIEIGANIEVDANGDIVITANKDFRNSGTIITDGSDNLGAGNIDIHAGNDITLEGGSVISAAGHGNNSDGGKVILWADSNATARNGSIIDARGGDVSGDGGFIEFSAQKVVTLENARMNAAAVDGNQGTVLIDPLDLYIDQFSGGGNLVFEAYDSINVHENTTISSYQAAGDAGDISFIAPIIDIRSGAEILANADTGYNAGDISFAAESHTDVPLQIAEARISVFEATIDGGNISFSTDASSTDMLGIEVFSGSNAVIDVDSSTVIADGHITMTANSAVHARAAGTPVDLAVDAAVLDSESKAEVNIRNSTVQVNDGNFNIDSASNVNAETLANASASGNVSIDAAVAVSSIDSHADTNIEDSSIIFTNNSVDTGNLGLASHNSVNVTTSADGIAGGANGAGATVAVSVVKTTSQTSLGGGANVTGASNINLSAQSESQVQTAATSTAGGSLASGDNSNQSEQRLSEYSAETNEGSVDVAGAVAISDLTSLNQADISSSGAIVASGAINIQAEAATNASTTADGSATSGDVGVGVAVGLNIASATNRAFIADEANVSGGSVGIKALMDANDASNDFSAEAISGAGASNVGVAGALALNVVVNTSEAFVEGDEDSNDLVARVDTNNGAIILEAQNKSSSSVNAGADVKPGDGEDPAQVGVGAS
ncbi:MAG: leukotoxin LktA family filamentous adhesin, partial [Desulfatiglans sp.]|nr:leukotoxin LktA family filamentous adhesin [Desulfatiglans sp.]